MEKINIRIDGMHCNGCATGIQLVAEGMDGVTAAAINFDAGTGTFAFDPEKMTAEKIIAELQKLGYAASL